MCLSVFIWSKKLRLNHECRLETQVETHLCQEWPRVLKLAGCGVIAQDSRYEWAWRHGRGPISSDLLLEYASPVWGDLKKAYLMSWRWLKREAAGLKLWWGHFVHALQQPQGRFILLAWFITYNFNSHLDSPPVQGIGPNNQTGFKLEHAADCVYIQHTI